MTDRSLRAVEDLDRLDWDKADGLVPVVVQDVDGRGVLMVAWANREALERSLSSGTAHFWSRSRARLWKKGETSGNTLALVSLHADCDGDTVLARVRPAGPACHTGEATCFGEVGSGGLADGVGSAAEESRGTVTGEPARNDAAAPDATSSLGRVLDDLDAVLAERQATGGDDSYTVRLLGDENLRLKKLGEETAELVTALAKAEADRIPEEAADLLYHVLVAVRGSGVRLDSVAEVLKSRR